MSLHGVRNYAKKLRKVQGEFSLSLKMRTSAFIGALHEKESRGGSACAEGGGGENGLKFFFRLLMT